VLVLVNIMVLQQANSSVQTGMAQMTMITSLGKHLRLSIMFLCSLIAAFSIWEPASAQDITFFRIGTGSTSGTYYPIGTLLSAVISSPPGSRSCEDGGSCGVPGLIAAAQTTRGSISNIEGVTKHNLETGLAQSDMVHAAFHGSGVYATSKAFKNLRVIANLYPESVHLVVRKGAGISRVEDLKGKRVSMDLHGSGTRENAKLILAAYGLNEGEFTAIETNPDKSVRLFLADKLDAFFFVAGFPAKAVIDLAKNDKADLLPISGAIADKIIAAHSFFSPNIIPAETYGGINETTTLAVSTQWVIDASMDEKLVYEVTKALWHPESRKILDGGHAKGKMVRLETALEGISTPLHVGAARFYREKGLLQ
jgi:uncharacterized protein